VTALLSLLMHLVDENISNRRLRKDITSMCLLVTIFLRVTMLFRY